MSDLLLMSQRELSRLEVLQQLGERRLRERAALRLSLSTRQLRRLQRAYQEADAAALVSNSTHRDGAARGELHATGGLPAGEEVHHLLKKLRQGG